MNKPNVVEIDRQNAAEVLKLLEFLRVSLAGIGRHFAVAVPLDDKGKELPFKDNDAPDPEFNQAITDLIIDWKIFHRVTWASSVLGDVLLEDFDDAAIDEFSDSIPEFYDKPSPFEYLNGDEDAPEPTSMF